MNVLKTNLLHKHSYLTLNTNTESQRYDEHISMQVHFQTKCLFEAIVCIKTYSCVQALRINVENKEGLLRVTRDPILERM